MTFYHYRVCKSFLMELLNRSVTWQSLKLSVHFMLHDWFTPPHPRDGGTTRTAIQVHAIRLGKMALISNPSWMQIPYW